MEAWLKRGFPAAANLQSKSRILFMIKSIIEKTRKTLRDCQFKVMNVKMKLMKGNMK